MDEDDVRVRPGRRGSRPRTRIRPAHEDAVPGLVIAVDRGRMTVRVAGPEGPVDVTTMRARELGKHGVVVGDRVRVVGDTSGRTDSLARIVTIQERTTSLRRTADDDDPVERVIVANADQLVVVAALADPEPRPRLIDRALVAAFDGTAVDADRGTEMPQSLSSTTKTTGSTQRAARLSDSWKAPWFAAPSPVTATAIRSLGLRMNAKA